MTKASCVDRNTDGVIIPPDSSIGQVIANTGNPVYEELKSDRWFPPKVIGLWTELHPFERMGLVLEYFRQTRQFAGMVTESWRGWPRPEDDKYYPRRLTADPVFAVSGQRC